MDNGTFSPGIGTLNQSRLYGSPQTGKAAGPEQTNARANSAGTGLRQVLQHTGSDVSDYSGLSLPALAALGVIAWWLFRTY